MPCTFIFLFLFELSAAIIVFFIDGIYILSKCSWQMYGCAMAQIYWHCCHRSKMSCNAIELLNIYCISLILKGIFTIEFENSF